MQLKFTKQLSNNLRTKVVEAVQQSVDRYFSGESFTSIMLPPRYGKSSVIRLTALELEANTKMPTIMLAPWIDNVDQILEKAKAEQTFHDYGVPLSTSFSAHRVRGPLRSFNWWKLADGTIPTLLSCTLDLVTNVSNRTNFCDGLDDMRQRFNCRSIVAIDECQLVRETKVRGDFIVEELVKLNDAYIVLLTGTPVPGIPGFDDQWSEWIDIIRKIPRRRIINNKIEYVIQTWEGPSHKIKEIAADVHVTWKEAWSIKALAGVNAIWINFDIYDEAGNFLGPLDKIDEHDLPPLRMIMEFQELMQKQVTAALDRLMARRAKPKCQMTRVMVVTGQDDLINDNILDRHAKLFKTLFEEEAAKRNLRLRIEIATGNVEKASSLIKQFRSGQIDILIVKSMAIVGLDVPPCKILVWGSRLRRGPLALQALSRVLTTWEGQRADIIMPQDQKMVRFYNGAVKDAGGEESESKLILTDEEPFTPEPDQPIFKDPRIEAYGDETGKMLKGDYEKHLRIIKFKYEVNGLSDLQIIENYDRGGFPYSEEDEASYNQAHQQQEHDATISGVKNLDEDYEKVAGGFGKKARAIVGRYLVYDKGDLVSKEKYTDAVRKLQNTAKELHNVSPSIKVSEINDVALIKQLIDALDQAELIVFHDQKT
jgi:hypothetical protein